MTCEPTITGVSKRPMALYKARPNPGQLKVVSRIMAPVHRVIYISAKVLMMVGKVGRRT